MYYRVTTGDSFSHHGIKGMRWGIRRFQNEDGTLTSAGRKRYGANTAEDAYKDRAKDRDTLSKALSSAAKSAETASKFSTQRESKQAVALRNMIKVSDLSDDEIQKRINRIRLEQSYKDAVISEYNKRTVGKLTMEDVLKNVGTVAATASAVITVASAVNQILASSAARDVIKNKN